MESANVKEDLSEISKSDEDLILSYADETGNSNNTINDNTSLNVSNNSHYTESEFTDILKDSGENEQTNQSVGTVNYNKTEEINNTQNSITYQTVSNYSGNEKYTSSNATSTVSILKTVISSDLKIYYKSTTKYSAVFLNSTGGVLANANVKLTVNKKTYTVKTDSKGRASLSINLKPGTYTVTAYNPVTGYSVKNTLRVLSTITANDLSKVYTDGKKFTARFYKSNGKVLAKKTVKFKINGKIYKVKTNSNGVAGLKLNSLKKGTYKIISYNPDGLTLRKTVKVYNKVSTSLTTNYYIFLKSDKKVIKVKLLNKLGYTPGKGKIIKIKINKKTYTKKTNSNGIATLTLPKLSKGTYTVKYTFAGNKYYYKSSASNKVVIIPSKTSALSFKSTTVFGRGAGTPLKVALTAGGINIAKQTVTIKFNGHTYTKTTDSNGIASLKITNPSVGKYNVTYSFNGNSKMNPTESSTLITVKERTPTSITLKSETTVIAGSQNLKVLLLDNSSKALSGKTVTLTLNSKTYTAKTSSNGYATFSLSLSIGTKSITLTFNGDNDYTGSSSTAKITVNSKYSSIPLQSILSASKSFKNYYATYKKLPSTVTVNGAKYTAAEFLYLMSQAIVNLGNSKTGSIKAISISNPTYSTGDTINSKALTKTNYLKVSNNVLNYLKTNKKAPNYASSSLGKIAYEELLDSFSRILDFYNTNKYLPNSVTVKYSEATSVTALALKLTAGLTSQKAKATVLFEWVRDNIGYSFYYNTVKGASKTLSSGTGNCCDQAQLLVALARAAGLTARFATGYCKFSSGSWYGHVWVQIKVSGSWHALDTTSSKNTYNSINNWNTASYTNRGTYTTLPY